MEAGDYVRTDKGYIAKISDFIEHYTKGKRLGIKEEVIENFLLFDNKHCEIIESIDYSIPPCYPSDEELAKIKSHIVKSSPNIIDLIEIGDYVNGHKVIDIAQAPKRAVYIENSQNKMAHIPYTNDDIKSIVTKEQFENCMYKIGE